MCVVWVLVTTGDGVCVGWVLISHGNGVCVVWVLTAARLRQHGDMGVCVCVLVGCSSAMETWARAGWVLVSNGNMGVCLLGADQQWRHGCVLVCC